VPCLPFARLVLVPNCSVASDPCVTVPAHRNQTETCGVLVIKSLLVFTRRQPVPTNPFQARAPFPYRCETYINIDPETANLHGREAVGGHLVEGLLVLAPRHPVPRFPIRRCPLFPDRGVPGLSVLGVTADANELVAFCHEIIECRLVLVVSQAVARLPCGAIAQLPDSIEPGARPLAVSAYIGQPVPFSDQQIKNRLIGLWGDPVPCLPCRSVTLVEQSCEACVEAGECGGLLSGLPSRVVDVGKVQVGVDLPAAQCSNGNWGRLSVQ
jgi:hypothetical protein